MPRKGDVNGDGVVDTNVLLGTDTDPAHKEYAVWSGRNLDGQIDVDGRDIQGFVQNYIVNGQ